MHEEVLSFWFREIDPKLWWSAEPSFDELIRGRFLGLLQAAAAGRDGFGGATSVLPR